MLMPICLDYLNGNAQAKSFACLNAIPERVRYYGRMAEPRHDWYLKEWLAHYGKRQADIVRDLDWNKARVSLTASGKQPYTRDDVNEVALYLNLKPFELLMHPDDAMALRRLRADMIRLAHEAEQETDAPPEQKVSLG